MPGRPTGTAAWRRDIATAAAGLQIGSALQLEFVLPPAKWVDLDTITESTARGLRDAGALAAAYRGLDAIVATKRFGERSGVRIVDAPAVTVSQPPPGAVAVRASDALVPRPGNRDAKRAWRAVLADAWGNHPPLTGEVWAEVTFAVAGSLFGPLEVVLDALEPVLGRDPRGRSWQEFFPNDDRIRWLRVRRDVTGPAVALQLGMLAGS